MVYHHRQFSRPVLWSLLAAVALIGVPTAVFGRGNPAFIAVSLFAVAVIAATHYLMSSLTVDVGDGYLTWHFAGGFWRKRVALADIARVERVRLPWWYGIGIKATRSGWVYLVAPGDGVRLALTNGEALCVGTDDAERLMAVLAAPK
jgi:hypothetical protein